jgi:hypothetical protein
MSEVVLYAVSGFFIGVGMRLIYDGWQVRRARRRIGDYLRLTQERRQMLIDEEKNAQ